MHTRDCLAVRVLQENIGAVLTCLAAVGNTPQHALAYLYLYELSGYALDICQQVRGEDITKETLGLG